MLGNWRLEIRPALRSLRRSPGFTAVAIGILGLGLGANVTIFTVAHSLLLRPPPGIAEPERLVRITRRAEGTISGSLAYPDYPFYRDENRTFTDIAAYGAGIGIVLASAGIDAVEVRAALVSANYFDVLGTPLAAGRGFRDDEGETPGSAPVVLVSHRFWQAHLGGITSAVGSRLAINGHPFTIVGVVGTAFQGIGPAEGGADVWVPLTMRPVIQPAEDDLFRRVPGSVNTWIRMVGRLAPGVDIAAARADLDVLARRLETEFPYWNEGAGVHLTEHFAFQPALRGRLVSLLRLLAAAAATVLLIACANLALLLLARASARRREFGVRAALGAGRGQILSRFLAESLLLAGGGSLVGIVVAVWSGRLAGAMLPVSLDTEFRPDAVVLAFALGLGLLTALVIGVVPAWATSRTDLVRDLKDGARARGPSRLRHALVAVQVGLSLMLLAGTGLFVRSFTRAQQVELGFEADDRLLLTVNPGDHGYDDERGIVFVRTALERLAAVPGVRSVGTTRMIALGGGVWTSDFGAPGAQPPAAGTLHEAGTNAVGPDYFRTMGIPILAGREFTAADDRTGQPVIVVNQTLARQLWGDASPLGRVLTRDTLRFTVIGLARDAAYYDLGESPQPQLYFSALQLYQNPVTFVIAANGSAAALAPDVRRVIRSLEAGMAISGLRTFEEVLAQAVVVYRNVARLVGALGTLALVLAAAGLYGVLAHLVALARREIAVRMALGAEARAVALRVLRTGLGLTAAGIAVGTVGFVQLGPLARAFLFEVEPRDPATIVGAAGILLAVAAAASYLPARRAANVDPMEVLRDE
jgi:predicted permease